MKYYTIRKTVRLGSWAIIVVATLGILAPMAVAAVGKGHSILIQRGLQTQGMVTKDDVFSLTNYQNANYTTINWLWESNVAIQGAAPGYPWARWVNDENQMPTAAEQPYLSQLVALQLGDEWDLNNSTVRDRAVNWFNAIRAQWPNTILYMNNWGGQVNDAALGDFVTRAHPDMLSFDTYPFQSDPTTHVPNAPGYGSPTNWYSELRRYRIYAQNAGVPWAIYRQTFHAIEGTTREYRDPSPSEMNLNSFGALAFGASAFMDFTYNTGASNVAPSGNLLAGYTQQTQINRRARNLGKALVHLTGKDNPLNGSLDGGQTTLDVMYLRGKTGPNTTDVTPLPIGFQPDDSSPNTFSEWASDRNDPYMRGWVVTNLGTKNGGLKGDVTISWLKPLDATKDDPNDVDDELYFMVVNGFTGPDGTAADYRQRIQINFLSSVGPTLQRLNSDTGGVEFVNMAVVSGRRQLDITLDGGEGQLFKFNTGHAFLGTALVLSGDYNGDEKVDAADYVVWRKNNGTIYNSTAYATWRANFGRTSAGGGAAADLAAVVPEPLGRLLFGLGAALLIFGGRSWS